MYKKITKEDVSRAMKFMAGKKLTPEQRKKLKFFWKYGSFEQ